MARTLFYQYETAPQTESSIAIVTAGTVDMPVAEEAKVTAEALGNKTKLITDVDVAGIHRLFSVLDVIRETHG